MEKRFDYFSARAALLVFLSIVILLGSVTKIYASWFVDERKLHISAHGQTSCIDCHEDIEGLPFHPNPQDVNKKEKDFFKADTCFSCHDDVMDELQKGLHSGRKIKYVAYYNNCIKCHDPHTQPRLRENRIGKFDTSKPRYEQCGACHEERSKLPPLSEEDEKCMSCHRLLDVKTAAGAQKIKALCIDCHGKGDTPQKKLTAKPVPLIDTQEYGATPHAGILCTQCHLSATQFGHSEQGLGDCLKCHYRHDEKVAHALHARVACEACHLKGIEPVRAEADNLIEWKRIPPPNNISVVHEMVLRDREASCTRCHFRGNKLGAVSTVLPPKSVICMPCHSATFSISDKTTVIALIVFLLGWVAAFAYWITASGSWSKRENAFVKVVGIFWDCIRNIFSSRIIVIIKALVVDVLFQRRLYRQSRSRWLIHSMIFLPFVFRFVWGIVALIVSLSKPQWRFVWAMLDKNYPLTGFLFDLTGLVIIAGIVLASIRGFINRKERLPGLPDQDKVALGLIAAIVVMGFFLEGARIAMTGWPHGAEYAFGGRLVSMLFAGSGNLDLVYGRMWYVHAILTGAFVAYVPFSRMFHIIMAPIVLAMNAVSVHGRRKK